MNSFAHPKTQSRFLFSITLFCFLLISFLTSCRTTTLDLTLNGRTPKNNRVFGANLDKTLGGGLPEGGVYSGPGVQDGMFNPAQAGNGIWTITYSKFGYKSSSVDIEVYGAYESISEGVCKKCGGTQTEICPVCLGTKIVNNKQCTRCNGTGSIPCQECMVANVISDVDIIEELAPIFACSRVSYDSNWGTDDFIFKFNPKLGYTNIDEFHPTMFFRVIVQATQKLKRYILPSLSSESIECDKVVHKEGAQSSFYFSIEGDTLTDSNIRIVEVNITYGVYNVSLLFDLDDLKNGKGLSDGDMKAKYIIFNDKYYRLPQTIFIDDTYYKWEEIKKDKGWLVDDDCSGWLLQTNNKGDKRILDPNHRLRIESDKENTTMDVDNCWSSIKQQIEDNSSFWDKWFNLNPPMESISHYLLPNNNL